MRAAVAALLVPQPRGVRACVRRGLNRGGTGATVALQQAFDYGSEEWEIFHDHARNTIECENQQLKASGDDDIATAGRRKVRGVAASLSDQAKERARTTPRVHTVRCRDRVWANRYTKTTGNRDLAIPRGGRTSPPSTPATI